MVSREDGGGDVDRLLTVKQTIERLNVSARTIHNLKRDQILPAVYVGRALRFRESDVQRIIREGAKRRDPSRSPIHL